MLQVCTRDRTVNGRVNLSVIFNGMCTNWRDCVHFWGLFCTNVDVTIPFVHAKTK